jgi:hypothetical protein
MKKILFGTVLGVVGTVVLQKLYRSDKKFRTTVNNFATRIGIGPAIDSTGRPLNIFDKLSIIYQKHFH